MLIWFVASFINGHLRRDIVPRGADIGGVPRDVLDHATLRFKHGRSYGPLQKLSYFSVFFILFPLIVLTGLSMSPGMNAAAPWLLDLFGGRQTARTIHFIVMLLLVAFFVVHVLMVVAAGPINELRSMITGWYRASAGTPRVEGDRS
jgi:thiosulfate reductase cytochrome b subunit